ncbi:CHAT domain-containing protein [Streptomyces adustus]|uniref:CHAT domain-containing protein n=1 Tax=Streptomyces adustus TaxID=1609272 RepID=A0A5N8VAP8_9ACTN|nr:CHAT domain-containing protein [Streptomyces adustus]MPY31108.1 CHAT domain-containing protein [Streptomyces adustus]
MSAVIEAMQLAQILRDEDGTADEWQRLGFFHWLRYEHPDGGGYQHDLSNAVWAYTPCFLAGTEDLPEPLLPSIADHAVGSASALTQFVMASEDPSAFSEVVQLWDRILEATPADHPGKAVRLNSLGGMLQMRAERAGPGDPRSEADLERAVGLFREALSVLTPDDHQRAFILNNLGAVFQTRFEQTGSAADLDLAVKELRAASAAPRAADSSPLTSLLNLTDALQMRSELSDDPGDLDDIIRYGRMALDLLEPDADDRGPRLANLGVSLYRRYVRSGAGSDLGAAAEALRSASAGHNGERFNDRLSAVLCAVFEATGEPSDLEASIDALRAASRHAQAQADSAPARGHRAELLRLLGEGLATRFGLSGARADLDAAVHAFVEALPLAGAPASSEIARGASFGLATTLATRYERYGSLDDLNTAVQLLDDGLENLPADHPRRYMYLSNLGGMLESRFDRLGGTADLDRGIDLHRQAVALVPLDAADRPNALNNLGTALRVRFRRHGGPEDLDDAITHLRQAKATGTRLVKGHALHNLGAAHAARFNRTGDVADIDAAIEFMREAIPLLDATHRPTSLSSLGQSLLDRFQHLGALDDLDAAIAASAEAVDSTPTDHQDRPRTLSHLGTLFEARFDRLQSLSDADAAIDYARQAVRDTPHDHFERAGYLLCLGNVLVKRYLLSDEDSDAADAAEAAREAVELTPEDSAEYPKVLNLLCGALTQHFEASRKKADLDEAIDAARAALRSLPSGHYGLTSYLNTLAVALCTRFEYFGDLRDAEEAMTVYERSVADPLAAPSLRIEVARTGARRLAPHSPGRAADLMAAAVRLLPEVAPRRLERLQQQERMGTFGFLASEAAALLLADTSRPADQRATQALETLEAGRGVLLSQTLETRSDLTDLGEEHPELAARFEELRARVDTVDDPAGERVRLTTEFSALLRRIRELPGLASFGLPPSAEQLLREAAPGPVVTINAGVQRGDALLLTSHGIRAIELPGLTLEALFNQTTVFHTALEDSLRQDASLTEHADAATRLDAVLAWLWDVVAEPVLEALGLASTSDDTPLPRLWWVSSGLLSLLPLHAAGHHGPQQDGRTVMDRVVSSYTPTIRALGHTRTRPKAADTARRSLIVAMPTTPHLPERDLPQAGIEASKVARRLPSTTVLAATGGTDRLPTAANVLTELAECAFAHFVCHGQSNPQDPSQSRLLLHDHAERPFTVASLTATTLHNAQLAYLSACETAVGHGLTLLDESIHLAGAFQLAGFPHVIGTLWSISDDYSAVIAESFYTHLTATDNPTPQADEAARALHTVIRHARDEHPHLASRWAAYLHTGA